LEAIGGGEVVDVGKQLLLGDADERIADSAGESDVGFSRRRQTYSPVKFWLSWATLERRLPSSDSGLDG
jgi:hypothetical protein